MVKLPGLDLIAKNTILYMAGDGNYTRVYQTDGSVKLTSLTLSKVSLLLPDFLRVHKSSLVNPTYIQRIERPSSNRIGAIHLATNISLNVSRRKWATIADSVPAQDTK